MSGTQTFDYLVPAENNLLEGFDSLDTSTMATPFIRLLQALSPQCNKNGPDYVEGASEGMFYNTLSKIVMPPPLQCIVVGFEHYCVEWKAGRGGFVREHSAEAVRKMRAENVLVLENQNERITLINPDTRNEFTEYYEYRVILPDYIQEGVCSLCLSSTQLKEGRRWNRLLMTTFLPGTKVRALPDYQVWALTTPYSTKGTHGWSGLKVDFARFITEEELPMVLALKNSSPPRLAGSSAALENATREENLSVSLNGPVNWTPF